MWWPKSSERTFKSGFGPEHRFLGTWTRRLESGEEQPCDVYWSDWGLTARYGEQEHEYMASPWVILILQYIRRTPKDRECDDLLALCFELEPMYNITVAGVCAPEYLEDQ